jgi:23S rRNA pseudouridine2605 synthase
MARAGLCSRRDAEEWINDGRVSVNGTVLDSPALVVRPGDTVLVDGQPLPERERTRLWLYHKPKGLVTTEHDPEGRPTVFDNLPGGLPRVLSIGRLDINTEGLLLLTNDGGLARVIAHPDTAWLRRYRVRVHGEIDQAQLDTLQEGITLEDFELGEVSYGPIVAKLERSRGSNAWLTMDLREGKNREIKRVLEHFGLQVTRLIRVSFGPFQLGELEEGEVEEIRSRHLREQLGERLAEEAGVDFDSPLRQIETRSPRTSPQDREGRSRTAFSEEPLPQRQRYDRTKPGEKRSAALLGERPDLTVTREKVADRKGRNVKVERIATRPDLEADHPRNRFTPAALSDPDHRIQRGPRRTRDDSGDRPPRRDGDGEARSFRPRPPRRDGDGEARSFKPRAPRRDGDGEARSFKPRAPRRDGDGEARSFKPRPPRHEGDGEARSFKPRPPRREGDGEARSFKPRPPRREGDGEARSFKPRPPRREGDGEARSFKPRPPRREGDGEARSFKPRPPRREGDGEARSFKPRAPRRDGAGDRPGGDRPPRRPGGGKGADRRG